MTDTILLDQFAATLAPGEAETLDRVRAYVEWQAERLGGDFRLRDEDDVPVRTYLAHLRAGGMGRAALRQQTAALKQFYSWAQAGGLIKESPFEQFNIERPILSREQIRRRQASFAGGALEREVGHLRALNHLAGQLNRSLDVQTMLDTTLESLVEVMRLKTAWAFVLPGSGLANATGGGPPLDEFALGAACRLPPGLEASDRLYLRQGPDCHCQFVLREGQMTRAVNVVECTRLQDSAEAQGDNQGLLFHASVPLIVEGRPVGLMNFATEEWQFLNAADLQLLTAAGALASSALERARLYDQVRAGRARLEVELAMARQVQASLLPDPLPQIPGFGLAAEWRAAHETAGDFYDVFAVRDTGRWAIVIGDVSDKGAPAALYMAMTRSLLRSRAEGAAGPAALVREVNRGLMAQSSSDMFVSLFCGMLDTATGTLAYANAGHNPPVLRRSDGSVTELAPTGPLVGVFDEPPLAEKEIGLAPGDVLVAYTDGLTEACNSDGEEYGARCLRSAASRGPATAADLLEHLLQEHTTFTGGADPADDVTLLVLTRLAGQP
jgi:serine phosphatase RsbU (regulator of sigma subunit)